MLLALSRVGARVVESGPEGEDLAARAWRRLEAALPDLRSLHGQIFPLAYPATITVYELRSCRVSRCTSALQDRLANTCCTS